MTIALMEIKSNDLSARTCFQKKEWDKEDWSEADEKEMIVGVKENEKKSQL